MYQLLTRMFSLILWFSVSVVRVQTHNCNQCKVYRLNVQNDEQLQFLHKLRSNPLVDFWSPLRRSGEFVDVMVYPQAQTAFTSFLNVRNIRYEHIINNLEKIFQQERSMQMHEPLPQSETIDFTRYNRYREIVSYLNGLARSFSHKVALETPGVSYENRKLTVVQISSNRIESKPVIFIDAGIHAREWIAPATALYIIHELVENLRSSYLLDKVDWHVLPLVNPDGYEYSHVHDRLWRKTRSPQGPCYGTDGNRNFDFHWGETGASSNPCSIIYKGPFPFSENETRAVSRYGNFIIYPWGYTSEKPRDHIELRRLAQNVSRGIVRAGGEKYKIGTCTKLLYGTSGGSDDWAKGVAGIELSYSMELPGGGKDSGFDPSPNQIIKIVRETFPGIVVFGKYIGQKFGK